MLKILTDECIHQDLIDFLRGLGFDVATAKESNLTGASDDSVFNFAIRSERTLLTFDRGFGDIFRFNIKKSSGVIIILLSQMTKREIFQNSLIFLKSKMAQSLKGKLVVIGGRKVRIKTL